MMDYKGKNIWLVGASSGIGRSLALELSWRGATLALSARQAAKLEEINRETGGLHHIVPCDVADAQSVATAADKVMHVFPRIDSVVFLAGTYTPMRLEALDLVVCRDIIATNLMGALHVLHSILPRLLAQKSGQIALCASVAGYRGLPNAQPYSATKAGLINLAESLRAEVEKQGIDVRIINPGFVRTPMTDKNVFPMPLMIEPEQAAVALADGLLGRRFEIGFPRLFVFLMKILKILPSWLYFRVLPR